MSTKILSQDILKECFIYDPETGALTWSVRPREHFNTDRGWKMFNTRFAGKTAGSVNKVAGYLQVRISYKPYQVHRVIWCLVTGAWPKNEIDHEDHKKANNRWGNLREATHQENGKNQPISSRNKSGVTGVSWHKQQQKWRARINIKDKGQIFLGCFEALDGAMRARKSAEVKYNYHKNHGTN